VVNAVVELHDGLIQYVLNKNDDRKQAEAIYQ